MPRHYYAPEGGLPAQTELLTDRAVFTEAYAVIPKGVMQDIVTSYLPFWDKTRAWVLSRPLSGFAETFSQYIMEVLPGGGSNRPEPDAGAEAVLFVVDGELTLTLGDKRHILQPGGYAYVPPAMKWTARNGSLSMASMYLKVSSPVTAK
jgi:(S)-ureidoglycine aminohydrolase